MSETGKLTGEEKTRRGALGGLFGVAAAGAALTLLPASRARADIGDEFGKWWEHIRRGPRKTLPDFLRTVANSIETDSYAPFEKYARANPDFPLSPDVQKMGKPPWKLIGRILIAIGTYCETPRGP